MRAQRGKDRIDGPVACMVPDCRLLRPDNLDSVQLQRLAAHFADAPRGSVSEAIAAIEAAGFEIVAVNEDLGDSPERINEDPYGEGWLVRVRLSDPSEVDSLLDAGAYEQLLESSG